MRSLLLQISIGDAPCSSLKGTKATPLCPQAPSHGPEQTIPVSVKQFLPETALNFRVLFDSSEMLDVGIGHRYLLSEWQDLHCHQHMENIPSSGAKAPQLSSS